VPGANALVGAIAGPERRGSPLTLSYTSVSDLGWAAAACEAAALGLTIAVARYAQ